ncbi:MAG TPA: hypothetical protein VEU29_00220 [Actinomycetota bacterium]|nr:hypothetical protein [Actinomycetota bacterium]
MRLRLRLLDTIVEIHTEDATAGRLVSVLWSAMETGDAGEPARVYELTRSAGGWTATAGDDVEAVHADLWGVTDALRYRMLELCEERIERYVTLHAAAVARDGHLVLLAGRSGAGKTTLTLALLDAGWTYLSDDLAPVSTETGLVHPFPKPLGVKDPAVWESVSTAFPEDLRSPPPAGSFLVPPALWEVAATPLAPSALLFPEFVRGASVEVDRLTPARGAAAASAYLRRLDPTTLGVVNRLCAGAESASVRYGSSEAALQAVEAVLDDVRTQ